MAVTSLMDTFLQLFKKCFVLLQKCVRSSQSFREVQLEHFTDLKGIEDFLGLGSKIEQASFVS